MDKVHTKESIDLSSSSSPDENDKSPPSYRNPSPPPGFLGIDHEIVDVVPGTVISKCWVLSTLSDVVKEVSEPISMIDEEEAANSGPVELNEDIETEMCKLWDVAMDTGVANFLLEENVIPMLTGVIERTRSPRLVEICLGIFSNLACNVSVCDKISANQELINMTLNLLANPDPPTLVETTRLLIVCLSTPSACNVWMEAVKRDSLILGRLTFILESSTNENLLKNMAELMDCILDREESLCEKWACRELVVGVLEAMKQLGNFNQDTMDTYWHILQVISTNKNGVQSLVHHGGVIVRQIRDHVKELCEDLIVSLGGRRVGLASAVSVLRVVSDAGLAQAAEIGERDSIMSHLKAESSLFKYLLQLLPAIHQNVRSKSDGDSYMPPRRRSRADKKEGNTIGGILLDTVVEFWLHVIHDLSSPLFVLQELDKAPAEEVKILIEELKMKSPDDSGFDYVQYLNQRVQDARGFNRLADLLESLT